MPVEQRGSMRRTRTEVDNSTWHWEQQKLKVPGGNKGFLVWVGPKLQCRAKAKERKW